jgi:hypothetical protein
MLSYLGFFFTITLTLQRNRGVCPPFSLPRMCQGKRESIVL